MACRQVDIGKPTDVAVRSILSAAGLPTDDLATSPCHFLGIGQPARPEGVVGLEVYGDTALLRSLVVCDRCRGRGHGHRLVAAAESFARERGVQTLYLLTESAETFFSALGYVTCDRSVAPKSVQRTRQFTELCPASAVFMCKNLRQ